MNAFIVGYLVGFSLILAIGAQNAFVLRQGIKQQHVFIICLICACSDAILFGLGVLGFATLVQQFPWVESVARYGGALFLVCYGLANIYTAITRSDVLKPAEDQQRTLVKTVLTCLAFTWLNPHVYLDTVVFMGTLSTQFEDAKLVFFIGASLSSFTFFFSLGYGARLLTPLFNKVIAWKILDFSVAILMFVLAFSFVFFI